MSNFKSYLTNWKIVVPVLCGALIVGAFAWNGNTEDDQTNTPADQTTAQTQAEESVNVEVEAATLEENTNSQAADNNIEK